ncbi:MAG: hypothetical protein LAT64_11020 [Phycisphaerales bacterium]|nr:hypothetical protein [Planctomycetota bacterium]MCH8509282.1 hypothetical protein [Phycisphaerales bacterium]
MLETGERGGPEMSDRAGRGSDEGVSSGVVSGVRLLPALFVRPGVFFRSWGADAPLAWVIGAAWLVGIGSMSGSILNRMRADSWPSWLTIDLDGWMVFWVVVMATGVLRGLGAVVVGGGWFRARLWLSGVRTPCWGASLRLYIGGRFVEQVAGVLALIGGSFVYASPSAYLGDGVGRVVMIAGVVLLLWGGVVPFLGARALFRLNRWSWLWLFALPVAWRLAIAAAGFWWTIAGAPSGLSWNEPGTRTHQGPVFSVVIHRDWIPTDRPDGVDAVRPDGRASWGATIVPTEQAGARALALGGSEDPVLSPGPGTIGRWTGDRWEHRVGEKTVVIFDSELDNEHRVLFRLAAPSAEWGDVYADLERCMASAFVVDPRFVGVDAGRMTTIGSGSLAFEVPENWIVGSMTKENDTLGTVEQIHVRSPGAAEIFVLSYRSEQGAAELFGATREELAGWYTLGGERLISVWRGMPCVGMEAAGRTRRGMPIRLRVVVLELADGARAEILTVFAPHEPESLRRGLRHFEESVRFEASGP